MGRSNWMCRLFGIAVATGVAIVLVTLDVPGAKTAAVAATGGRALYFEPNQGQAPSGVAFVARGRGFGLRVHRDGLSFALLSKDATSGSVVRMTLVGASDATPHGASLRPGRSHYLKGRTSSEWVRNVPNYGRVEVSEVYPGIDVVYYGRQGALEYDFVVQPGADPMDIRLAFNGATHVRIDASGNLVLETDDGRVMQRAPVAYQEKGGRRIDVAASFQRLESGEFVFELGNYDAERVLVIDPVLVYGTYVGGVPAGSQRTEAMAVDAAGTAYLTGMTTALDFPVTPGAFQDSLEGVYFDAFVVKIAADGTVVYSTYLGGSDVDSPEGQGIDQAFGIAANASGRAYVVGLTLSEDFPVSSDAYQPNLAAFGDAFLSVLSSDGSTLEYGTFLGGDDGDQATGVLLDETGRIVISGITYSSDFPTVSPAQGALSADMDGFLAVFEADGSALSFSTYLGGSADDWIRTAPALDSDGNIIVAGITRSDDFPTTAGAYQEASAGWYGNDDYASREGFVTKYSSTGALLFSTYFGGDEQDLASAVAVDASGDIYITGETRSQDLPITSGAYQASKKGRTEPGVYVAKLSSDGASLLYSTFLDPSGDDRSISIVVDGNDQAHVLGQTSSRKWPAVNALQGSRAGSLDSFVTVLNAAGDGLVFSTYFGGSGYEEGREIELGPNGLIYICGRTQSTDLPITGDAMTVSTSGEDFGYFAVIDVDAAGGGGGGGGGNGKGRGKPK